MRASGAICITYPLKVTGGYNPANYRIKVRVWTVQNLCNTLLSETKLIVNLFWHQKETCVYRAYLLKNAQGLGNITIINIQINAYLMHKKWGFIKTFLYQFRTVLIRFYRWTKVKKGMSIYSAGWAGHISQTL